MDKVELLSAVVGLLREKKDRKKVKQRRSVFHITDDDGNHTSFIINTPPKRVLYTRDDVKLILEAFVEVVNDCMAKGEPVNLFGVGTFYTKHMNARRSKDVYTSDYYDIPERHVPGFRPAGKLRTSANLYDAHLNDPDFKPEELPEPIYEDDEDQYMIEDEPEVALEEEVEDDDGES